MNIGAQTTSGGDGAKVRPPSHSLRALLFALVFGQLLRAQSADVRIVLPRAIVRAEPSAIAPILTSVPYGATIQLRSEEGSWARVLVPDARLGLPDARVEGWVRACAVRAGLACAAPKSNIAVSADVPGRTYWLNPVASRAVPVLETSRSLADIVASPGLTEALAGETTLPADGSTPVTWVWTISTAASAAAPKLSGQPTFLAIYRDVPGLEATSFAPAIVRVAPSPPTGVVAIAAGRADAGARDVADWTIARDLKYDVVTTTPLGGNVGMIKVRPAAPLAPGLYALVLRPMYLTGYSGARVFGEDGIGLAFGEAWLFAAK